MMEQSCDAIYSTVEQSCHYFNIALEQSCIFCRHCVESICHSNYAVMVKPCAYIDNLLERHSLAMHTGF